MPVEDEYSFACPHCSAEVSIAVDFTAGHRQAFTTDCEVCCRPIAVEFQVGPEGVSAFNAERES